MKDSYMIFVILAVLITPFLPNFLKAKCPNCGLRKLDTLEPETLAAHNIDATAPESDSPKYITYFACKNCEVRFQREKSGPLVPLKSDVIPSVPLQ